MNELVLVDREEMARSIAELVLEEVRRHTAPEFLTIQEAAEYLRCSEDGVSRRVRSGKLPGYKESGRWLFSRKELAEYVLAE